MKKTLIALFFMFISLVSFSEIKKGSLAAFSMVNNSCNINKYTAKDYAQNGLIALFDGIENADWGVHDSSAHIWQSLIEGGTRIGNSSMSFGKDYMTLSTTIYAHRLKEFEKNALAEYKDFTIEFLVEVNDTVWNMPFGLYQHTDQIGFVVYFYPVPKRIWYGSQNQTGTGTACIGETVLMTFVRFGSGKGLSYIDGVLIAEKDIDASRKIESMYLYKSKEKQKCIRIYDRALTSKEIYSNYLVDKSRFSL